MTNHGMVNLGKLFRLKAWQGYQKVERRRHQLTAVFWETTLRCNLNCRHCGSSCGPTELADDLTTGEIKRAIAELAEDYDPREIMFYVTGGEPLLRPDLFEVTSYMSHLGFVWGMVTNGTLVNPSVIDRAWASGMATVSVSLDGLEDAHDWLRGRGTFRKALAAVRLLKDAGFLQTLEITTCANRRNVSQLQEMYRAFSEEGVDQWRILMTSPIGRARENAGLLLTPAELRPVLEFIRSKRLVPGGLPVTLCEEGFLGPEFEGEVRDAFYYCPAGISIGSILYNGAVSACPSIPRDLVQGSIRNDRFSAIWEDRFKPFRDREWMKTGRCRDCRSWGLCHGNSLHLWDFERNCTSVCHLEILGY